MKRRFQRSDIFIIALGTGLAGRLEQHPILPQADNLVRLIGEQLRVCGASFARSASRRLRIPERPRSFAQMLFQLPARCLDPRFRLQILRPASVVLVVFFIGLFMAASPETYRRGMMTVLLLIRGTSPGAHGGRSAKPA